MTEITPHHSPVRIHISGRTAWITIDSPPLNVLNIPTMRALDQAVLAATQGATPCDFIVFKGAGLEAFSAGASVSDHTSDRVAEMLEAFHAIFRRLWRSDVVTIAAVHGHCLGGGMELATFCDFLVATDSSQFGQPEIKLGCYPPLALVMLPHLIGLRAAMDLILTGRIISAMEAHNLGLVSRVIPDGGLQQAVESLLGELYAHSSAVLQITRRALLQQAGFDFESRLRQAEKIYLGKLMQTADAQEGIRAFMEKRTPVWSGR